MPGLMLHVGATMTCTHQVVATIGPGQVKVLVDTKPVATMTNQILVAPGACPFQIPFGVGTKPQPCVKVVWANVSTKVLVDNKAALLQTPPGPGPGGGVCQSAEQIPAGPPVVNSVQLKVIAT